MADAAVGSKADLTARNSKFRFTPEADSELISHHVGFVPKPEVITLFDHLVGGRE
jgi:hypothetical protein